MGAVTPAVRLDDIRRRFTSSGHTVTAVDGVSLEIRRGETLGMVGESGSGKSTVGRILVGLDMPSDGRVLIENTDASALGGRARREAFRRCQMVFQDPYSSLNPRLTVGRQITEALHASGVRSPGGARTTVEGLLAKVGLLPAQADRFPHEFSGGQRQRIAIARALAPRPAVLVADEPVSALDVSIQAQIIDLFAELQESERLATLFISHDIAVVARLSERICVIHRGRIVEFGTTRDVIGSPQHPYTQSLLDAVPRLGRRRDGSKRQPAPLPPYAVNDRLQMLSPDHGVLISSTITEGL